MNLRKQALSNTVGNILYLFAIWMLTVITTQFIDYEAVGNLTLAMALGNVFFLIQTYGIRSFQSSDMSFEFVPGIYLKARFITSLIGLVLCIITCILLDYSLQLKLSIIMYLLFKTSEAMSDVFYGDIQRKGRLEFVGYSLSLRAISTILLFFVGAYFFRELTTSLLIITIGGLLLTLLLDFPFYKKTVGNYMSVSLQDITGLLRKCFPLLLATLLPLIIMAYPRVVLENYYGAELLGFYGNISTPSLLLSTVVPVILVSLYPQYGIMFDEGNYSGIMKTWYKSLIGSIILSGICILGAIVIGRPILVFVYTDRILPYFHFLFYILFATMLYVITVCNGTVLVIMRNNNALIITTLLALALCIITSAPLIHANGIDGAITTLVIAYVVQSAIQAGYIIHVCKKNN